MLLRSTQDFLKDTKGRFFSVEYYGLDKQYRKRVVRIGVKKHLMNQIKEAFVKPLNTNTYMRVYDVTAKGYRTVRIESISRVKYQGMYYIPVRDADNGELIWV